MSESARLLSPLVAGWKELQSAKSVECVVAEPVAGGAMIQPVARSIVIVRNR